MFYSRIKRARLISILVAIINIPIFVFSFHMLSLSLIIYGFISYAILNSIFLDLKEKDAWMRDNN